MTIDIMKSFYEVMLKKYFVIMMNLIKILTQNAYKKIL